MKCNQCGFENKDNAKFCSKCGSKLGSGHANAANADSGKDNTKIIIAVTAIIIVAIALFTCYSLGVFGGGETYDSSSSSNAQGQSQDTGVSKVSLSAFPVSEAPYLAQEISKTGSADNVNFKGVTLSKSQVLYVLTKSISMIGSGNAQGTINVGSYSYCAHPRGADVSQTITSSQYIDMCNRFSSWMERNGVVPNYVGINTGGVPDVSPTKMINMCDNILIQYKNTGSLPATVNI